MRKIPVLVMIVASGILASATHAADPPRIEWQRSYGGTNDDIPFAVERGAQGEIVLAGVATIPDYWLLRAGTDGNPLAEIRHGGGGSDFSTACSPPWPYDWSFRR